MSDPLDGFYAVLDGYIGRALAPLRETIKEQQATIQRLEAAAQFVPAVADVVATRERVEAQAKTIKELEARQLVHGKDGKSIDPAEVRAMVEAAVKAIPLPKNGDPGRDGTSVDAAEVRAMVADAVKALPVPKDGENGKSVDPTEVRAMVVDAAKSIIGALPVPKDGKSVDPADVRAMVAEAVKAIPAAKDGDPGTNGDDGTAVTDATIDSDGVLLLTLSDGRLLRTGKVRGENGMPGLRGEKGADAVVDPDMVKAAINEMDMLPHLVDKAQSRLEERVDAWLPDIKREAKGEPGKPGDPGKQGDPGASAYAIAKAAGFSGSEAEWLSSLRGKDGAPIHGKDGASAMEIARAHGFVGSDLDWLASLRGKDGDDGRHGVSILSALVDGDGELVLTASDGMKHRAGIVRGKDGADAVDGKKGEPGINGRDAVAIRPIAMIEEERTYPAGTFAHHAGGAWYAERSTEPIGDRRPQDCGWIPIAVGEQSCSVELAEDLRTVVVKRTTSTGLTLERRFKVPVVIDRGIYTAAKDYERGDAVTRAGSYFVARVDKPNGMPGASDDWRMLIKGAKP